jgi:hypothetical protein
MSEFIVPSVGDIVLIAYTTIVGACTTLRHAVVEITWVSPRIVKDNDEEVYISYKRAPPEWEPVSERTYVSHDVLRAKCRNYSTGILKYNILRRAQPASGEQLSFNF